MSTETGPQTNFTESRDSYLDFFPGKIMTELKNITYKSSLFQYVSASTVG